MGILNVTPDSFSDGGRYLDAPAAIARGREMLAEGADIVDAGAESTRPGSEPVPAATQIERLVPVIEALAADGACVSVDTAGASVAARALDAGAAIVNDVTALRDPAMAPLIAETGAGVVLMHMRGTPATMQEDPRYDDVVRDVRDWLELRVRGARRLGVTDEQIVVDPGIGFGKTATHNFELLARLEEFGALGRPLLIGVSRKSFLGKALDLPVGKRLEGGLAATAIAVLHGAHVVRTHDVAETLRAVKVAEEVRRAMRANAPGGARGF
jgi:dihydropteroate synthase